MAILVHVPWWIWLAVNLIPYSIERQKTPNMQLLALSALSWQFALKYQKKQYSWSFSLPWIKQIQRTRALHTMVISLWTKFVQEWVKKIASLQE